MAEHNRLQIVPFEREHGDYIAANMRIMDRKEIYYMSLLSPAAGVACTVEHALAAWTAIYNDKPALIFGINRRTAISEVGCPWLLATPVVDNTRVGLSMAVGSRLYFERFKRAFPKMENHVLAENEKVIRWLRWLGFDMEEAKPYGFLKQPFVRFGKGLD